MGKKSDELSTTGKGNSNESDESSNQEKAKEAAIEKVEDKKKEVKAVASGGKPVNIIGDIEKPDDDAPAKEWKEWAAACMSKLDKVLSYVEPKPQPEPQPKSKVFWDKEIF